MTTRDQTQVSRARTLFKSIDIFSDGANTFAVYSHGLETNNQATCIVLAKWFKHSRKNSNEMVEATIIDFKIHISCNYCKNAAIDMTLRPETIES